MKKLISGCLTFALLLSGFAIGGCQNDSPQSVSEPETAKAVDFGGEKNIELKLCVSETEAGLFKKQVDRFIVKYPESSISIDIVNQDSYDYATQITGDPDVDVFTSYSDQIDKLSYDERMLPLDDEYAQAVRTENVKTVVNALTSDGKLYGFPEDFYNGYYLVYDKSVVSDNDAQTLEGVLSACQKAGKQFMMDYRNGFYSCVFPFTGGAVTDGFEKDKETQKFADYDETEAAQTLLAFSDLMEKYQGTFVREDPSEYSKLFKDGKIAAAIDGVWNSKADEKALGNNFGVTKLPTVNVNGENKQMISMYGFTFLFINGHTKYPKAAQALASYLSSEECQLERAKALGKAPSNLTARNKAADNPIIAAVIEQQKYCVMQANISGQFWPSMGELGIALFDEEKRPRDIASAKKLLSDTIKEIKDN